MHTFAHGHLYAIAVTIAPVHTPKKDKSPKVEANTYDYNAMNFDKTVVHTTLHTLAHQKAVLHYSSDCSSHVSTKLTISKSSGKQL